MIGAEVAAPPRPRILVIATSGLGRFVPALGAMGAIRAHHRDAKIILLTDRATSAFAPTATYFDDVWIDESDGELKWRQLLDLRMRLMALPFARVYDLDASVHSKRLF